MEAGLLHAGQQLGWKRPQLGQEYTATVTPKGGIMLDGGQTFDSPSRAAKEAANIPAYDGWHAWRLQGTGELLNTLRDRLAEKKADSEDV